MGGGKSRVGSNAKGQRNVCPKECHLLHNYNGNDDDDNDKGDDDGDNDDSDDDES